jgi:hypothetical protein
VRGTIVLIAVIVLGFFFLLALARWRSEQAWTEERYERERKGGTSLGNAILASQAVFDPGAQHALEQRQDEDAEQTVAGAPPDPSDAEP